MKTSKLIGPALDWAVAKSEGYTDLRRNPHRFANDMLVMTAPHAEWGVEYLVDLDYSTDWSKGGPIIEREKISPSWSLEGHWMAYRFDPEDELEASFLQCGHTPLIAAMRCYVASKLGDEVDIPKELLGEQ